MTFSICVRERYTDRDGTAQRRFGVAATTRLPGVGALCPFVSEHGAVAMQALVDRDLGRRGLAYLADGLAIDDALRALVNADERSPNRQLHGVGSDETFAFSGTDCRGWCGHDVGQNVTVAGNLLTGSEVLRATMRAYESTAHGEAPLAERLIDALAAGHEAGGDRREDLPIQSAAVRVANTETGPFAEPYYNDIRVDATETPIADIRETFELATRGWADATAKYEPSDGRDGLGTSGE